MFSGWCWIGDGEPGTKLGKASATTHFGPHRGGGLMMTADLSTRRRHHPSLSLEFGVVGGRLSSIQLQAISVSPDPLYLSRGPYPQLPLYQCTHPLRPAMGFLSILPANLAVVETWITRVLVSRTKHSRLGFAFSQYNSSFSAS